MTVYLHIGLHKTGTSSLQAFLRRNKAELQAKGYLYPATGWVAGGHHNLAYELLGRKRFSAEAGRLADLGAELAAAPNAVISSEEFEFLELGQVRQLKAALGDQPVRVLVYLRRQDALIASTFAQQVKMGARMPPFEDYAAACLYNPRFDFAQLIGRWAGVFGEDSLDVAVVSDETAGARLFDDFLGRLGLRGADLNRPHKRLNESPSSAEIEVVRRTAEAARRPGRPPRHQDMVQLLELVAEICGQTPTLKDAPRLSLSPPAYSRTAARFAHGNAWASRYVASPTQRSALVFGPDEAARPLRLSEAAIDNAVAKAYRRWPFAAEVAGG